MDVPSLSTFLRPILTVTTNEILEKLVTLILLFQIIDIIVRMLCGCHFRTFLKMLLIFETWQSSVLCWSTSVLWLRSLSRLTQGPLSKVRTSVAAGIRHGALVSLSLSVSVSSRTFNICNSTVTVERISSY